MPDEVKPNLVCYSRKTCQNMRSKHKICQVCPELTDLITSPTSPFQWQNVHSLSVCFFPLRNPHALSTLLTCAPLMCVLTPDEPSDGIGPNARGLSIPCPERYKNYCINGDCQYSNGHTQPTCRYWETGKLGDNVCVCVCVCPLCPKVFCLLQWYLNDLSVSELPSIVFLRPRF